MLPAANLPTTLLRQSNVASVSRARRVAVHSPRSGGRAGDIRGTVGHPGGPILCADAGNPSTMHLCRRRFL